MSLPPPTFTKKEAKRKSKIVVYLICWGACGKAGIRNLEAEAETEPEPDPDPDTYSQNTQRVLLIIQE